MDPSGRTRVRLGTCFPRTRGDGPLTCRACIRVRMFPPHARGWTAAERCAARAEVVSPARAGMDPGPRSWRGVSGCFPRTRGDGPTGRSGSWRVCVFPPHARGWTRSLAAYASCGRVSPARAGMDRSRRSSSRPRTSFPRTRGDGPSWDSRTSSRCRFPPHARGWTADPE